MGGGGVNSAWATFNDGAEVVARRLTGQRWPVPLGINIVLGTELTADMFGLLVQYPDTNQHCYQDQHANANVDESTYIDENAYENTNTNTDINKCLF